MCVFVCVCVCACCCSYTLTNVCFVNKKMTMIKTDSQALYALIALYISHHFRVTYKTQTNKTSYNTKYGLKMQNKNVN